MHVWITSTLVHVLSELLVLPAGFYTSTLSLKDNLCVQSFNSVSELSLNIKYLLLPLSITKIREASEPNRQNFQIEWGKCNTAHVSVATTWGCNFGNLPWFKFEIWNGRYSPKHLEWFINSISVFEINLDKWFNELARNVQMWVELVTGPPDVINCFGWKIKSSKKGNVNFKEHNTNIL